MRRLILSLIMGLIMLWPQVAWANAAEPPGFILLVEGAPPDLEVRLILPDDAVVLPKERRAWETVYRLYYHDLPVERGRMPVMELEFDSGEALHRSPLHEEALGGYSTVLTYDFVNRDLSLGESPGRTPLLIMLRVSLTLIIEGVIFFLLGYRQKRSWIIFLLVNLVTQGGLNLVLSGPAITQNGYWFIAFLFLEAVILSGEAIVFPLLLREHTRKRALAYAILANLFSLILGGALLTQLPV